MLRLHRIARADRLQQLRRKGRNAGETQIFPLRQRVTNAELPVVRDADDIPRPSVVRDLPVIGQEQHRVGNRHRLAGPDMFQLRAAFEVAGAKADKRHPVPVLRVHIRLNLKDKA